MQKLTSLHNFFLQIFDSTTEFRIFVKRKFAELSASILGDGSRLDQLIFSFLEICRSRGYLDDQFFNGLLITFPKHSSKIQELKKEFLT